MSLPTDFYTTNKKVYNMNDTSLNKYSIPIIETASGSYDFCEYNAYMNLSPFFILADGNKNSTGYTSKCYLPNNDISQSVLINWINNLHPDTGCSSNPNSCYTISGDNGEYILPYSNYFSVYTNPYLEISSNINKFIPLDPNHTSLFNSTYNNIIKEFNELKVLYIEYYQQWYLDVSLNDLNVIYINNGENLFQSQENYYKKIDVIINKFYYLNSLLVDLELNLKENNNLYTKDLNYIKILNDKIKLATQEFNRIMSEKTGALGMLHDNIYNTNLIITQNVVLLFTILITIFIYFKYISN